MRICFFQARTGLMEPAMRFELMTSSLPRRRSTPELRGLKSTTNPEKIGAGDEIRTRDPQLGRLMLYQLSYTRSPNCEFRVLNCESEQNTGSFKPINPNSKSEIRNSKSDLPCWCRGQDSNLRRA